jgi:site-specific recombinase XerD
MAAIDELISTYLTACEVEGKTANTVTAYRATLRDFRRVGERLRLPDAVEGYSVPDVYTYLAELRERGASAASTSPNRGRSVSRRTAIPPTRARCAGSSGGRSCTGQPST